PAKDYKIAAHYQVVLSEDRAEAIDIATKALVRYVGATTHTMDRVRDPHAPAKPVALGDVEKQVLDVAKMVEECRVVAGTPDDAVKLLTKAQEMMGMTQVDCTFYF